MSTVTEIVREVALLVEREPRSRLDFFMREVAQLNEIATVTPFVTTKDVALLNDAYVNNVTTALHDTALLNDIATATVTHSRVLREKASLSDTDRPSVRHTEVVHELTNINDAYAYDVKLVLRDIAKLNDVVSTSSLVSRSTREVARLKDAARPSTGMYWKESALVGDAYNIRVLNRVTVRESALISGTDVSQIKQLNILRESASLLSRLSSISQTSGDIREIAFVSDNPVAPAYGRAYTCSVITWGMSTYSNFPFLTMTNKFASGSNLWSLGASDDYGTPITWKLVTGMLDFGVPSLKHMSAVYVAGSASSPISVSIIGDVNGGNVVYDYDLELRDQSDYRNNRALIGKGFRSRFFQVKFGATDINARLLTADADIAIATRRM